MKVTNIQVWSIRKGKGISAGDAHCCRPIPERLVEFVVCFARIAGILFEVGKVVRIAENTRISPIIRTPNIPSLAKTRIQMEYRPFLQDVANQHVVNILEIQLPISVIVATPRHFQTDLR